MVNFNNESTVSTSAANIVKILVLQRRADLIEALEGYKKQAYKGLEVDIAPVRARLFSLFIELQGSLKRQLKSEADYIELKRKVESDNEEEMLEAIYYFNEYLDKMRLTRIDTKETYDSGSLESENKVAGL